MRYLEAAAFLAMLALESYTIWLLHQIVGML